MIDCNPFVDQTHAALAQQPAPVVKESLSVAEPVAWRYRTDQMGEKWVVSQLSPQQVQEWNDIVDSVPLYAAPPDHREALRWCLSLLEKANQAITRPELERHVEGVILKLRAALGEKE